MSDKMKCKKVQVDTFVAKHGSSVCKNIMIDMGSNLPPSARQATSLPTELYLRLLKDEIYRIYIALSESLGKGNYP